jgi:hypothetical protein
MPAPGRPREPAAQPVSSLRIAPRSIIGRQTQGKAASPQDVQSQTRGGPTAAEQAQGPQRPAAEAIATAQAALEETRNHDRAGKEAECMDAVGRAKRSLG